MIWCPACGQALPDDDAFDAHFESSDDCRIAIETGQCDEETS